MAQIALQALERYPFHGYIPAATSESVVMSDAASAINGATIPVDDGFHVFKYI